MKRIYNFFFYCLESWKINLSSTRCFASPVHNPSLMVVFYGQPQRHAIYLPLGLCKEDREIVYTLVSHPFHARTHRCNGADNGANDTCRPPQEFGENTTYFPPSSACLSSLFNHHHIPSIYSTEINLGVKCDRLELYCHLFSSLTPYFAIFWTNTTVTS